jgi:predicted DNA repair protein MutK
LPIIAKITVGSLKNKLLLLLPGALLLSAFAPFLITPLLMLGGAYLAFEATEKIIEVISGDHHDADELAEADTPAELEARQVKGAVRTDFILSAEIMAIALNELGELNIPEQAAALALVAIAVTLGVYGAVALIVKLDDIGLHMAKGANSSAQRIGGFLVRMVPGLLRSLSSIGTAAMLWVGGGILLHGMEDIGLERFPHTVHEVANKIAASFGPIEGIVAWIANALAAAIVGAIVGTLIVLVVRQFTSHPEKLIVDA